MLYPGSWSTKVEGVGSQRRLGQRWQLMGWVTRVEFQSLSKP